MKKNIFITGATDGIGKIVATRLSQEGHHLFIHGRNAKKLKATVEAIKLETTNDSIQGFLADFSDLSSVQKMADEIKTKISHIDVLINNAGIFISEASKNTKGIDTRMSVNYLAPYLLTKNLLPLMREHQNSRIINLSSAAQAPVLTAFLKGEITVNTNEAYAQSKLALTMWSFYLGNQMTTPSVIAVNPGSLLDTKMAQEAYGQAWSSAAKGANILYDLAISDEYTGITAKYFDNDKGEGESKGDFGPAHADTYDITKIEALINVTEALIGSH